MEKKLVHSCTEFTDGNWIESKDQSPNGIRLIQTGNIGNGYFKDRYEKSRWISENTFSRLNCFEVIPGDCLISRLPDPVGRSCIIPQIETKMITAVDCSIARFKKYDIIPEWFVFYSQSQEYLLKVKKLCTGATRNRISRKNLGEITIPMPLVAEQRRIVTILDDAFERIDKAIANIEKNIANVNQLIERAIVDVVFGEPEGKSWDTLPVKNLAETGKGAIRTGPFGSQLLHSEFVDSGVAVLGIDNAVQNEFKWGKSRFISHEKYKQLSRYTVHPGDVLITIMGTCGRCAVVPNDIPTAINTKHLCCITLNKNKCTPEFLHDYFLYHPIARNYLTAKAKGAIMAGLNMEIIKMMPVLLPSLPRQKSITQDIASLSGQKQALITMYQSKLASLQALKQSLLAAAFSGELTADFNPDALEL